MPRTTATPFRLPNVPTSSQHAALSDISVPRTVIPDALELHDELGRGSNNRVYAATLSGRECVLRVPRRRSDTQQRGSAEWELRHTLRAAELGVGPSVYAAWFARHSAGRWPSGLYVVGERFDHDLEMLLEDGDLRERVVEHAPDIGKSIVGCLQALAEARIFVYDLKPSNVVVGNATAKVIDFGRDFCEWGDCAAPDSATPNIDQLVRRVRLREGADDPELVTHILFATMLVILSATTTHRIYHDRNDHRMTHIERVAVHPVATYTRDLLESMQGRNVALVREMLRADAVRGVLRHYHGRRYAGTRRTLAMARGVEM